MRAVFVRLLTGAPRNEAAKWLNSGGDGDGDDDRPSHHQSPSVATPLVARSKPVAADTPAVRSKQGARSTPAGRRRGNATSRPPAG